MLIKFYHFRNNSSPVPRPAPAPPVNQIPANRQAPMPPMGVARPMGVVGGPGGGGPPMPIQNRPLPGPPGQAPMPPMYVKLGIKHF